MICDRPDRGPKGNIVYGPASASRRHWHHRIGQADMETTFAQQVVVTSLYISVVSF